MASTLIHNIREAASHETDFWILIEGETIARTGHGEHPQADSVVDGGGCLALPGAIDCHVHFREPGMTHKANILSESRAAIAGGVTSYLEMPNTKPATTTVELWQQKMDIAAEKSWANYAFFIGATNDNIAELRAADYSRVPGVKLFMGSSTGNMLVDSSSTIARIFKEVDAVVAVHAEDQDTIARYTEMFSEEADADGDLPVELHSHIRSISACYSASARAVQLAREYGRRLHLCHLTTAVELSLLQEGDPASKLVTSEVSPHHLMWCTDDYPRLGSRIKMNPAVKETPDMLALRKAVASGLIDIVATDHAPHLLAEKQGGALKAVSGAPLVQFSLPWMLSNFPEDTVQRVMCINPAKVFRIDRRGALTPGFYADIVLVQNVEPYMATDADVLSLCGWTPLHMSQPLAYRVRQTWVNGRCAYRDGAFADSRCAMPLRFAPASPQV